MSPKRGSSEAPKPPWWETKKQRKDVAEKLKGGLRELIQEKQTDTRWRSLNIVAAQNLARLLRQGDKFPEHPDLAAPEQVLLIIGKATGETKERSRELCEQDPEFVRKYLLHQGGLQARIDGYGPKSFLMETLSAQAERHDPNTNPHVLDELYELHTQVASKFPDEATTVYTLYLMCRNVQQVREIITMQVLGAKAESSKQSFLKHMWEFVRYFEEVYRIQSSQGSGLSGGATRKTDALDRFIMFLQRILDAPELTTERMPASNLFSRVSGVTTNTTMENPLVRVDLKDCPFDARKIGWLMGNVVQTADDKSPQPQTTAECLANVLERLAAILEYTDILRATHEVTKIDDEPDGTEGKDARMRSAMGRLKSLVGSSTLTCAVRKVVEPLGVIVGNVRPDQNEMMLLRRWLEDDTHAGLERELAQLQKTNPGHESSLMLCMLSPQDIVEDEVSRRIFLEMYDELMASETTDAPGLRASLQRMLDEQDVFMSLPLEPCAKFPQYGGKSIRELVNNFVVKTCPTTWHAVIPSLTCANAGMNKAESSALRRDFSSAVQSLCRRDDLTRGGEALRVRWGNEAFRRVLQLLRDEASQYFDTGSSFELVPSGNATGLFERLVHILFPNGGGLNAILTVQEYENMTRPLFGRQDYISARYTPRTDEQTSRPLELQELLENITSRIDAQTALIVLSQVSRYGDMLCGASDEPGQELVKLLNALHDIRPDVIVFLDICQALGRTTHIPPLQDLPPNVIVLGTGGKMLDVQLGFAMVPMNLSPRIIKGMNPDGELLTSETLSIPRMWALAQRLRELRDPHCRADVMRERRSDVHPLCREDDASRGQREAQRLDERYAKTMQILSHCAIEHAKKYADGLEAHVKDCASLEHLNPDERKAALACDCDSLLGHRKENLSGIVMLSFRTLPPQILEQGLVENGYKTAGVRLEGTCLRLAFNEFQSPEDIDDLFKLIQQIHIMYLKSRQHAEIRTRGPRDVERARLQHT